MEIKAIAHLSPRAGGYALFGDDGYLYLAQAGGAPVAVARLPRIGTAGPVELYVCEPWVCVTERFGTNASLVQLHTAAVRELSRGDYYTDMSSYAVGFCKRDGRVLLIHQTDWNRLDITDAETGRCLTEREVYLRDAEPGGNGEAWILPGYEAKNYIDYFHSLLHVSPDGSCFASNGWLWHPLGQILCFRTEVFLRRYELSKLTVEYNHAYHWDRPCAFIGNDRLAIVTDGPEEDSSDEDDSSEEEDSSEDDDPEAGARVRLQVYDLNAPVREAPYDEHILPKAYEADCCVFTPDQEGHVHGALVWDPQYEYLVALTPDGAFALSLHGEVLASRPECRSAACVPGPYPCSEPGWGYNLDSHTLYHWSRETGTVEERRFDPKGNSML